MKHLELTSIHTFAGRMEIVKSSGKPLGFIINTRAGVWLAFHSMERPYYVGRFTGRCAKVHAIRRVLKVHTLGWTVGDGSVKIKSERRNLHKL
jgi:hypothetical protein